MNTKPFTPAPGESAVTITRVAERQWHALDDDLVVGRGHAGHRPDGGPGEALRGARGAEDLQWQRGRAWAFEQGGGAFWYYGDTSEPMATMGRTTLTRLIDSA